MRKGVVAVILVIGLLLVISGCSRPNDKYAQQKTRILAEIDKLEALSQQGTLQEGDVDALKGMVTDDQYAADESHEIQVMAKYQEYLHAYHGLDFLKKYITLNKEILCPGHALSHYYVYKKHSEDALADDSFKEAQDTYADWLEKTRKYGESHDIGPDFEQTASHIKTDIDMIANGNTTMVSDEELDFLINQASVCIQQ